MAKKITKTEEQLTKDLEAVMKKLYIVLEGTPEEKVKILRDKFERELQQINQPKQSEKMKAIIEALRQLRPHNEIAEQYNKHHGYISAIAKNNGIWSPKAVRQLLKTPEGANMSNEDLAEKTGAYPEAIERIRKEIAEKQKAPKAKKGTKKVDQSKEDTKAEERKQEEERRQQEEQKRQEEERLKKEAHRKAVEAAMERARARKLEREQEEQRKQEEERQQEEMKAERIERIQQVLKYGRKGMKLSEIAEKTHFSIGSVSKKLREHGIWNVDKIKEELRKPGAERRSNASWANQTGVEVETIRRLREEIESEKSDEEVVNGEEPRRASQTSQKSSFRERITLTRDGKIQITQEPDDIEAKVASSVRTYQAERKEYPKSEQELAEKLGIQVELLRRIRSRLSAYPAVAGIAKEYQVPRSTVEEVLKIMQREEYDRTHTVVQYKIKMNNLRSAVKREIKDERSADALEHEVDILVNEFTPFLTPNDYIFLAYGYRKARSYEKAIQLGEEQLGLDTPNLSALDQRIEELVQKGLDDKGKQEVAKTFKIFSGGNGDER